MLLLQSALIVRRAIAALAVLLTMAAASAAVAEDLTPDAAYALVVRAPLARGPLPKPEELAAARTVLAAQAAREPNSARWAFALAHVANAEARLARLPGRLRRRVAHAPRVAPHLAVRAE